MEPRVSKDGERLPGPRLISMKVHPHRRINSDSYTLLTMAWGQFVDHDITATAQAKGINDSGISCCHKELLNNTSLKHPECLEILIPEDDVFFRSKNMTCMEFSRSATAPRCTFGPREQFNQNTHFLDGSVIYGSTEDEANNLRTRSDGLLKTQVTVDGRQLLSPSLDKNDSCNTEQQLKWNQHCFGLLQSIDTTGKSVHFEQLRKYFFSPFALYDPDTIGNLIRGQVSQMSSAVDPYFTTQVTNRLFQTSGKGYGLDLVSINIQRGRDHGIPSYTRWRMMCGLKRVENFTDLKNDMHRESLKEIEEIYRYK
ncbi:Chorion peroxidase [Armadillidium nasatum]|uniref:Chorion peroxidase n=1 Tax=Armadillidium nasatum TaxID=96803 RepID=A0A5N5TCX9_9CRUS|nr:Chorion peroxidase [Armadillidium nasatum]